MISLTPNDKQTKKQCYVLSLSMTKAKCATHRGFLCPLRSKYSQVGKVLKRTLHNVQQPLLESELKTKLKTTEIFQKITNKSINIITIAVVNKEREELSAWLLESKQRMTLHYKAIVNELWRVNKLNCGSVTQWLRCWTCDWRLRVQSQPLHCRVQLWTSCSHTLSSASGVTTLWRYINQFNFKKISACEWQKFLSAAD